MKRALAIAQNPVFSTAVVCILLYLIMGVTSKGFFTTYNAVNLLQENAYLGIAAIGVTFVILTGGIDLSVGAVIGWTTIVIATLVQEHHLNPFLAMAIALTATTFIGAITGSLVHYFTIPPFLMTLGTLFLYRGWALLISTNTIAIHNSTFESLSDALFRLHIFPTSPYVPIRLALFVLLGAFVLTALVMRFTGYGRSLYAIGGSEMSSLLMGLPVARNKTLVYATSGFFAGLAGIVATTRAGGNPLEANGLELDAIAVAVVGGTLLSGGVGGIVGTFLGLVIFAMIQGARNFHTFDAAWSRIAVGGLLLAFILLQKLLQRLKRA